MSRTALVMLAGLLVILVAVAALLATGDGGAAESGSSAVSTTTGERRWRSMALPEAGADADAEEALTPLVSLAPEPLAAATLDAAPPRPALQLSVHHAEGAPAAGGQVALYDGEGELRAEGALGADGAWTHEGVDGPVTLFVVGLTPMHDRFELAEGRGEHRLSLRAGAVLQGRVLVNGAAPGVPFPLTVSDWQSTHAVFKDFAQPPGWARIRGETSSAIAGGCTTDADGHFLVSGLRPGSQVSLRWPEDYALDPDLPAPFPVTVPAEGVVLPLRRPYFIWGRVVHADGAPAGDAHVTLLLRVTQRTAGGSSSRGRGDVGVEVGEDGRFAVAIPRLESLDFTGRENADHPAPLLDLDLVATSAEGETATTTLSGQDMHRDHDVGDLVLGPSLQVTLRLLDPAGEPVAAAQVRPEAARRIHFAQETDAEGRVLIDLAAADTGWVTIVAAGFQTERVRLGRALDGETQDIVLTRASSVALRVLGPWDERGMGKGWKFKLSVIARESPWHDALLPVIPGRLAGHSRGPDPLRPDPQGYVGPRGSNGLSDGRLSEFWTVRVPRLVFDGLRASHAMRFGVEILSAPRAFGPLPEDASWESEELWLGAGEQRELIADLRHLQPER